MKTTLIWTINDLFAYGMVYGWRTREEVTCSYYTENNKAFTLTNYSKIFFYYHRRFLPINHKYKKIEKLLYW